MESAGFQAHLAEHAQLTEELSNVTITNQTNMETLAQANLATTEQVNNLLSTITYLQNQVRTLSTRPPHPGRDNDNNRNTGGNGARQLQRKVNLDLIIEDIT